MMSGAGGLQGMTGTELRCARRKGVFGMGNPKVSTRLPLTPMISMLGSTYTIAQITRFVKEN